MCALAAEIRPLFQGGGLADRMLDAMSDPWIRVHVRRGGRIVRPIPNSMHVVGRVAEWERWTGMRFPDDGRHTLPDGLATVEIDHARNLGSYWEPDVWIVHSLER